MADKASIADNKQDYSEKQQQDQQHADPDLAQTPTGQEASEQQSPEYEEPKQRRRSLEDLDVEYMTTGKIRPTLFSAPNSPERIARQPTAVSKARSSKKIDKFETCRKWWLKKCTGSERECNKAHRFFDGRANSSVDLRKICIYWSGEKGPNGCDWPDRLC